MDDGADRRVYCGLCRTFSAPGPRCGNCHRRRDGHDDDTDLAVARSLSDARVVHEFSRVRSGALTFGPIGRMALSLLPLLVLLTSVTQAVRTRNSPWIALFGVAAVFSAIGVAALLLEIWKRDRVD